MALRHKALAEFLGSMFLLAAVVGSGIMGEALSNGNAAIALLANTVSTAAALYVLISCFADSSGAHFNPLVTLVEAWLGRLPWEEVPVYVLAQVVGCLCGAIVANIMFGLPALQLSTHARSGIGQWLGEIVATFGLLTVILNCAKNRPVAVPPVVAAYIAAAYWFTSSTSFANPAVTFARAFSDTFAGIRLSDAPAFILAQMLGTVGAVLTFRAAGNI